MHPVLVDIGLTTIHTYGFLIALGFIVCLILMRRKAEKAGFDKDKVADLALWTMIGGLLGGRVLFIITQWGSYMDNPMDILRFWKGGLVFYGGFWAGFGTYVFLTLKNKLPLLKLLDIAAPSVAIAQVLGRFGCFAAGCCYGKPLDKNHPFAVMFTNTDSVAPLNVHIHPTQLYDALNTLIIFIVLQWVYKKRSFPGQVIALYLMMYAVGRFIVELYRGDRVREFVIDPYLSTSQFIALLSVSIGAALYWWSRRSAKTTP